MNSCVTPSSSEEERSQCKRVISWFGFFSFFAYAWRDILASQEGSLIFWDLCSQCEPSCRPCVEFLLTVWWQSSSSLEFSGFGFSGLGRSAWNTLCYKASCWWEALGVDFRDMGAVGKMPKACRLCLDFHSRPHPLSVFSGFRTRFPFRIVLMTDSGSAVGAVLPCRKHVCAPRAHVDVTRARSWGEGCLCAHKDDFHWQRS